MRRAALGLYTYFEFFLLAVIFVPILAVVALLYRREPGNRTRGRWMRNFGKTTSALTPMWRFKTEGPKPPDIDTKPYVVVSNHESTADPFLLSWLSWDMRWVSKASLFKLPIIGWLMRAGGDIPLRRGEKSSVEQMFAECHQTLKDGVSIMMFPEGTRSGDGSLGPFKDGAFQLAIEAGVPVLPVIVDGTRACRPKGSLWFGEARATAYVLEPIATRGLTLADVPMLRDRVRDRIAEALAAVRGQATAPDRAA